MKSLVTIIALVALVGLMVYTNPSKDDLGNFVRQYVMKESQKKMKDFQGRFLSTVSGGIMGGVMSCPNRQNRLHPVQHTQGPV